MELSFGTVNITVVDGVNPMGGRIIDFVFLRLIAFVWGHLFVSAQGNLA